VVPVTGTVHRLPFDRRSDAPATPSDGPPPLITIGPDESARSFIEEQDERHRRRRTWITRRLLRMMLSDFDVNGILGTYPLFLLSTDQWRGLLGGDPGGRLLDVGAAAGDVTSTLAPLFDHVVTTDISRPMVRRLRERGFEAHRVDLTTTDVPGTPFDAVALLNVLDRCEQPLTLLRRAVEVLEPGGHLLLALPLPYRPCYYRGPIVRFPAAQLPLSGATWVGDADSLSALLATFGLTVETVARAPYLSGGDRTNLYYELDATVVVARKPHAAARGRRSANRRSAVTARWRAHR
jgi:SAM-dependent methyltransferase